jgi:lipase (class 2)
MRLRTVLFPEAVRFAGRNILKWRDGAHRRRGIAPALILTLWALLGSASTAVAAEYAPLDQPGPSLSVPVARLSAALACQPGVRDARVTPVLLSPATGVSPEQNFSWNWMPALDKLGIPWCAYTPPHRTLGNIDVSGEYLVYAIRTMFALAHRRIAIIGHSQGGMSMRWALRFWPDTRSMVDDVIGLAADNHGTTVLPEGGCARGCPPADWQQMDDSNFMRALNSHAETFPGISYTEVYTHTDEVVQPSTSPGNCTSCLHTGGGMITNVATQDVCPLDGHGHSLIGTIDPVSYALAVDALTHSGPADARRIRASVCSRLVMPGVDLANGDTVSQMLTAVLFPGLRPRAPGPPKWMSEPSLPCYVYAGCTGSAAPSLQMRVVSAKRRRGLNVIRVAVRVAAGDAVMPVRGVTVRLGGRVRTTGAAGVATYAIRLRPGRRYALTATRPGCHPAQLMITAR